MDALLTIPLRTHFRCEVTSDVSYGRVSMFVVTEIGLHGVDIVDQQKAAMSATTAETWWRGFSALSRHGYRGGPSILTVAPPKVEPNWTWSTGKDCNEKEVLTESFEERERTRAAVTEGEKLNGVMNPQPRQIEKEKDASFSRKEKRKRDHGQASRGKNYVEEEKPLLRGRGVYSVFDT
uniref:Uncharacterized protein n=1 Tax=Aegilops tauschii TaxID=37682 RepID=M8BVS5_AEGTA